MPLAILSALLWDLRAQCEAQVRALTDAQKQLDLFRDSATSQVQDTALTALASDVGRVLATNRSIRESAEDATAAVSRLTAERKAQNSSS
jgi:hypothetical protein